MRFEDRGRRNISPEAYDTFMAGIDALRNQKYKGDWFKLWATNKDGTPIEKIVIHGVDREDSYYDYCDYPFHPCA